MGPFLLKAIATRRAFVGVASIVGLALLMLAACGGGEPEVVDLGDPATLGQRTFTQWCAPCHGVQGEGFINALDAPPLNADGETYLLTDAEILDGIVKGGTQEGSAMQPLGEFLLPEQQLAALEFVHTLWSDEQRAAHEAAGGHPLPMVE